MKKIQLLDSDLQIGAPLPWSVYAPDGELLLKKGQKITGERQKHILLTRGLYRRASAEEARELEKQEKFSLHSPFNVLDAIRQNVNRILDDMNAGVDSDYHQRIIKVSKVIQKLCWENADAALGAIILDQQALYSHIHPVMCALLTELLLQRQNVPAQDRLLYIGAALTQNIGMLDLQDALNKQSAPLTVDQQIAIRKHPLVGHDILQSFGIGDKEWLDAVREHHERPDGSGYPHGLKGGQVSLYARTLSLSDIYSAMVLPRQYRDGYYIKKALRDIFLQRGSAVDTEQAQILIKALGIYPPGTFVQLASGDTAIVVSRAGKQVNAPVVLGILSPQGAPYKKPLRIDTSSQGMYAVTKAIPRPDNFQLDRNQIWGLGRK